MVNRHTHREIFIGIISKYYDMILIDSVVNGQQLYVSPFGFLFKCYCSEFVTGLVGRRRMKMKMKMDDPFP